MANEFIARKGLIALEDSQITGSLSISQNLNVIGGLTASFDSSTSTAISGAFTSVSSSIASERLKNTTDTLTGDLTVTGTITAQEFHTEFVSASITYESGSHKFGDTYDDVHEFTGSINATNSTGGVTGSLTFTGGNLTLSGDDADLNLNITSGSDIASLTEIRFQTDGGNMGRLYMHKGNKNMYLGPTYFPTSSLYLQDGTGTVMSITGSSVGIGETSPFGKLHIKGSDTGVTTPSAQGNLLVLEDSENGLSILSSTAGAGYINFGDSDDNDVGMILYGHSSNSMAFWTNAGKRMTITSTGKVSINGDSTDGYLEIRQSDNTPSIRLNNGSNPNGAYYDILSNTGGNLYLSRNGSTITTLSNTDGNAGINDTSPTVAKLSVVSSDSSVPTLRVSNQADGGNNFVFQRWAYIRGTDAYRLDLTQDVSAGLVQYRFDLTNNSSTYNSNLVLDRGNVGIGVTSPTKTLDVNGAIRTRNSFNISDGTTQIGGLFPYKVITGAGSDNSTALFAETGLDLHFMTNGSISSKMIINSNGDIGIGTTSPVGDLHLYGGQQNMVFTNTNADGVAGLTISRIIGQARGYSNNLSVMQSIDFVTNSSTWYKGDIVFRTNNTDGTDTSVTATERMRIQADGNTKISFNPGGGNIYFHDSTNGASMFYIQPATYTGTSPFNTNVIQAANSSHIGFTTGGASRMVVDSNGFITTNPSANIQGALVAKGVEYSIKSVGSQSGYTQGAIVLSSGTDSVPGARGQGIFLFNEGNDTTWYAGSLYNSADRFDICRKSSTTSIATDAAQSTYSLFHLNNAGSAYNATGTWGTISSDQRLKENIVDATSKLDDVLSLQVRNFNYIGKEEKYIGFIAQELETVFPSLVTTNDTREYDREGNVLGGLEDTKGVKVGMDFAILVKAIQEQQAIIEDLKARIETLEG